MSETTIPKKWGIELTDLKTNIAEENLILKYRPINISRLAGGIIMGIVSINNDLPTIFILCLIHLVFSSIWLSIIELKIIDERNNYYSGFFPMFFDLFIVMIFIYITGVNYSFALLPLLTFTAVHSMSKSTNYGWIAFLSGSISFVILGFLCQFKVIKYVNIFINEPVFNTYAYIITSIFFIITNCAFYVIIRNFVLSNSSLVTEVNKKNEKLTELDRLKSQFFANISHEFRTPLTLIRTPLEAMVQGTIGPSKEIVESMYRNSTRLLSLITTLLDFSRIEAGRLNLKKERVSLSRLVDNTLAVIGSSAQHRGITLERAIDEDVFADADPGFFEKAFYNLLSNALKFTGAGGRIVVTLQQRGEAAELSVADTGIGIAPDKIATIFDRFSQADGSSSRKFEGTGIGLAFAKEIIDLHCGMIAAESEEGKGSRFTIALPALTGESNESDQADDEYFNFDLNGTIVVENGGSAQLPDTLPPAAAGSSAPGDERPLILIVDDNADMRALLRSLLCGEYRTIEAGDGAHALEVIASLEFPPDLVLSDVMMPRMDGFEMTGNLRKRRDFVGIPVILLTAKADKANLLEGFEAGAIDYVLKPFHSGELQSRVKAQLEMKLLRDRLERSNRHLYEKLRAMLDAQGLSVSDIESPAAPADTPAAKRELAAKIAVVEEFIRENFTDDLSREGIAAACGMSPDYMTRSFAEIRGIKMFDFLREIRLGHAAKLLIETDMTVAAIGSASGFESIRSFNRLFIKKYGMTPKDFRAKREK